MLRVKFVVGLLGTALVVSGCGGLPKSGPSASRFDYDSVARPAPSTSYALVDLDEATCGALAVRPEPSLLGSFGPSVPRPVPRIGVGDVLAITLWEAGSGGLFSDQQIVPGAPSQAAARSAALPDQVVAPDGTLSVPFAGRVNVAGLRPAEAEDLIVRALKGKTVEPQAMVLVRTSGENSVTVTGDAVGGLRITLTGAGDRVLDVIALAGGLRLPANEVFVRLTRGQTTTTMAYADLIANPDENVYLQGGDVLAVTRNPQTFTALGATGANGVLNFEGSRLTMEEAVGKVGGLLDYRANPAAVFLFRFEGADVLRSVAPTKVAGSAAGPVPVIYRLDLQNPGSYFCARQFAIADKDIVYVANAPLNELQKFLNIIGSVIAPVATGVTLGGR